MSSPTSKNPNLTRITQDFVDALAAKGGPPLYELSYEQARQVLIGAQSGPIKKADVPEKDMELPCGPNGKVEVRIVGGDDSGKSPLLFYVHGGGWVMGNKDTHDRLVREMAQRTKARVIFPNYTNSPDAQYPQPLEEIYAAFEYVCKNAGQFGLDTSKIIVSGDSVGGNMSIALALMALKRGGPKIGLEVLLYPVTDAGFDTDSYQAFADGPWLTQKAMKWFWDAYLPDKERRNEITACPLRAQIEDLKNMPQTLVITDENDVLRDEGEAYAKKLDQAGVKVASVRFNGTHHDFMMLDGLADSGPTRAAMTLACSTIKCFIKGQQEIL